MIPDQQQRNDFSVKISLPFVYNSDEWDFNPPWWGNTPCNM